MIVGCMYLIYSTKISLNFPTCFILLIDIVIYQTNTSFKKYIYTFEKERISFFLFFSH